MKMVITLNWEFLLGLHVRENTSTADSTSLVEMTTWVLLVEIDRYSLAEPPWQAGESILVDNDAYKAVDIH